MAENAKRLGCPVCDGVQMEKLRPSEELELTLDYCNDCGGMWFESGEVRQLRFCPPEILSGLITVKKQLFAVACPSCSHPVTRNSAVCGSCGRKNLIDCPTCGSQLERVQSERFTVDVCRGCRGVWFDNIDLSQVWNLQFDGPTTSKSPEVSDSLDTVVAVLRHSKDDGFGSVTDSQAPSGVASAEERDNNVFGTIADIVGGIFSQKD